MEKPPKRYQKFLTEYPKVSKAYEEMNQKVHEAGPLDAKTRSLIKLALSSGSRFEGSVHAHTRKALEAGATPEEIRHTVMLALPTVGLPTTMAAMSWVDDILDKLDYTRP